MMLQFLPLIAFVLTLLAVPCVKSIARRVDFVDKPGGRKQHDGSVAYGGGVAIFAVFALISYFILPPFENSWAYFLALGLILFVGVIDDKSGVNAKLKFGIHFLSAFILVIAGKTELITLGNLLGFGDLGLGWAVIPFSVACIVYIINAMNMMDGLDGLAGGQSLIIFLWLMIAAGFAGYWGAFWSLAVLSACVLGFLVYNARHPLRKRASIFLGDAGSMALGLTIAWYCIQLSQEPTPAIPAVSVAWIIALPIVDAFGLLVARLKDGKHPFEPDRRHFHHHFLEAGFTPAQATSLILLWTTLLGAVGFVGLKLGVPEPVLGWAWITLWLGHAYMTMKPQKIISILTKIRCR